MMGASGSLRKTKLNSLEAEVGIEFPIQKPRTRRRPGLKSNLGGYAMTHAMIFSAVTHSSH
jgi:hypothetical protein